MNPQPKIPRANRTVREMIEVSDAVYIFDSHAVHLGDNNYTVPEWATLAKIAAGSAIASHVL